MQGNLTQDEVLRHESCGPKVCNNFKDGAGASGGVKRTLWMLRSHLAESLSKSQL